MWHCSTKMIPVFCHMIPVCCKGQIFLNDICGGWKLILTHIRLGVMLVSDCFSSSYVHLPAGPIWHIGPQEEGIPTNWKANNFEQIFFCLLFLCIFLNVCCNHLFKDHFNHLDAAAVFKNKAYVDMCYQPCWTKCVIRFRRLRAVFCHVCLWEIQRELSCFRRFSVNSNRNYINSLLFCLPYLFFHQSFCPGCKQNAIFFK